MIEKLSFAILFIVCALILFVVYLDYRTCKDVGGIYVRGLFAYECIPASKERKGK